MCKFFNWSEDLDTMSHCANLHYSEWFSKFLHVYCFYLHCFSSFWKLKRICWEKLNPTPSYDNLTEITAEFIEFCEDSWALQSPQHITSCTQKTEIKIWRVLSALSQWHINLTRHDLCNAAWAHIHLRNICPQITAFLFLVIANKFIIHQEKYCITIWK